MKRACVLLSGLFLAACQTTSQYDEWAYQKVTACKAEVLLLMDRASTPFADNKDQIDAADLHIAEALEFDKGRPLNNAKIKEWNIIIDPKGGSYDEFVRFWHDHGTLSKGFISESKTVISSQFDQLIQTERNKVGGGE